MKYSTTSSEIGELRSTAATRVEVIEEKVGKCQRKVEHEGIRGLVLSLGGCMYINRLRSRLPPNLGNVLWLFFRQDNSLTYTL